MSYCKSIMGALLVAIVAVLLSTAGPSAAGSAAGAAATESPLRLSISATSKKTEGEVLFHTVLENVGDRDVIVNLGQMLANGKVYRPEAVRLILTDTTGRLKELLWADTRVAGRVDDYLVPLRAGSTYSIRTRLSDYWCRDPEEFTIRLQAGEYRIKAELVATGPQHFNADMKGVELMNVWTGNVQSDTTDFRVGRPQ